MVDPDGENSIAVISGANALLSAQDVTDAPLTRAAATAAAGAFAVTALGSEGPARTTSSACRLTEPAHPARLTRTEHGHAGPSPDH